MGRGSTEKEKPTAEKDRKEKRIGEGGDSRSDEKRDPMGGKVR